MSQTYKLQIKDDNQLWFLEKNISVFDCLEFFEKDSIVDKDGKSLLTESEPIKNIFETDLGWSFESFIEKGKFYISERSASRSGTAKFIKESNFKIGDSLIIEKVEKYKFKLSTQRG